MFVFKIRNKKLKCFDSALTEEGIKNELYIQSAMYDCVSYLETYHELSRIDADELDLPKCFIDERIISCQYNIGKGSSIQGWIKDRNGKTSNVFVVFDFNTRESTEYLDGINYYQE